MGRTRVVEPRCGCRTRLQGVECRTPRGKAQKAAAIFRGWRGGLNQVRAANSPRHFDALCGRVAPGASQQERGRRSVVRRRTACWSQTERTVQRCRSNLSSASAPAIDRLRAQRTTPAQLLALLGPPLPRQTCPDRWLSLAPLATTFWMVGAPTEHSQGRTGSQ